MGERGNSGVSFEALTAGENEKVGIEASIEQAQDLKNLIVLLSEHEGISIEGQEQEIPVATIVVGIEESYEKIIELLFQSIEAGEDPDIDVDEILADSAVTRSLGIRPKAKELIEQKVKRLWDPEIIHATSIESLFEILRSKDKIPKMSSEGTRNAEEIIAVIDDLRKEVDAADNRPYRSKYVIDNLTPSMGIRATVKRLLVK